ncbi:MAG: hypothetical protein ACREBF_03855 [Candidatus Micrarchaeales archaeon]
MSHACRELIPESMSIGMIKDSESKRIELASKSVSELKQILREKKGNRKDSTLKTLAYNLKIALQKNVFDKLIQQKSRSEIASELDMSQDTVKTFRSSLRAVGLITYKGDLYKEQVTASIATSYKTIDQISSEQRIPPITIYRIIERFENLGMLYVSGTISQKGKKSYLYKLKPNWMEMYENAMQK